MNDLNLLNVKEWDKDVEYRFYDVVTVEWQCLGCIKRVEYFVAIAGTAANINKNKNPITFTKHWKKIDLI